MKAVRILAQNWINNVFETLYLGIQHHREKQAGLSTAHNGGITHDLSATSPEATRKNIHMNKLNPLQINHFIIIHWKIVKWKTVMHV